MDGYPVDDGKLATLAASRSGRVALAGFEYQRAFAVLRLAALMLRQSVPGCADVPRLLRYEWAEDIDELCMDDRIVLWQCKHGDDWHSPAPLAEVLLGFAPKWLWTPADQRHRLAFRLVTSDRTFAAHHDLTAPLPRDSGLRDAFLRYLAQPPGPRTDRAQWQGEADAVGHAVLFDALCQATEVAYLPGLNVADPRLWTAERRAVDALAQARRVADPSRAAEIVGALRLLLDVNATHVPAADGTIDRSVRAPRWLRPYEVEHRLHPFAPGPASARLDLVDRPRLEQLLTLPPGAPYVARRPEWSDVVRGADPDLRFLERVHTEVLERRLREALTGSLRREGGLRFLPVLGAPGAGKSTLALRVAAKLVLEGYCVAVDLRHPLDREEDSTALVDALRTLGEGAQPVLLVLDDPLDIDSGWPRLLQTLARHRGAMVALAATPAFLYDRHQNELRPPVQKLDPLALPPPDRDERRSLATLYPEADAQWILDSEEELLVLAMQAAADENFDAIIEGLWRTLADGRPIPSDALGASLPWPVAAFGLVCWFHRAYVPCPLLLLQAFLAQRPDVGADAGERLRTMTLKQGWRIFQLQDWQGDRRYAYQGGSVTTMHARVAQRAWELRPASGWDLGRSVAACSATCPVIARQLGTALVGMHRHAPDEAEHVLAEMAEPWTDTANASIETRYLSEFSIPLNINQISIPGWFRQALLQRVAAAAADSWLAALALYYLSHPTPRSRKLPDILLLRDLVDSADFSIAQNRATKFIATIACASGFREQCIQRLWAAFEGNLSWQLGSTLLTWLLSNDSNQRRVRRHLGSICRWLEENPQNTDVRTKFIGLLSELSPADRANAVSDLRKWLRNHPDDTHVRTRFINYLLQLDTNEHAGAIDEVLTWLRNHPSHTHARAQIIKNVMNLEKAERDVVIIDLRKWLRARPKDTKFRTKLIDLLGEIPPVERTLAIEDIAEWLLSNPEDTVVHDALLSFERTYQDPPQAEDVRKRLQWVKTHPDDVKAWAALVIVLLRSEDVRLADLMETALSRTRATPDCFKYAPLALRACASLPSQHMQLMCDWLDWASEALESTSGIQKPEAIVHSTLHAMTAVRSYVNLRFCSTQERTRARRTLLTLEAALDAWHASAGSPPELPH